MEQFLLAHRWRVPGYLSLLSGGVLAVIYFTLNPRLEAPVFAIFSSYIETKVFAVFRTNIFEELVLILLLAGLFLLAFTKEKHEKESYPAIRSKALFLAVISSTILMGISILFVFGSGFLGMAILNIYTTLIFYLLFFNLFKGRISS